MKKYIIGFCVIVLIVTGVLYYSRLNSPDEKLLTAGNEVLSAIKNADYQKLESLVSSDGLSWDHYINIDFKNNDYHIPKDQISSISTDSKKRIFGYSDGSGAPIEVTGKEYMEKYVYRHDYLDEKNTVVTILKPAMIINDAQDKFVMKQADLFGGLDSRAVVAYHYSNPAVDSGFDYSTIYLIFDTEGGEYKLRGIARYYWTI